MASVNKVILVGNLGADPESRNFDDGGTVTNISVATTEKWTDKQSGEVKEKTEWHRVVFYRRLAEVAAEYLRKGSQVYVEGSLRTRKWQDQSGVDKYTTEVVARTMQMLGSRANGAAHQAAHQDEPQKQASAAGTPSGGRSQNAPAPAGIDQFDDDIPF